MSARPHPTPEQVVLLDDDHQPIGTMDKALVHGPDTPLHLAFSVYLFGPDGRFLATRRALGKRTWGGVWTNSCCGHPGPGEDVEQAARRRVGEELSLAPTSMRLVLPDFSYRAVSPEGVVEHEVCPVFVAEVDADPEPDPGEVAQWRWVDWADFHSLAMRQPVVGAAGGAAVAVRPQTVRRAARAGFR